MAPLPHTSQTKREPSHPQLPCLSAHVPCPHDQIMTLISILAFFAAALLAVALWIHCIDQRARRTRRRNPKPGMRRAGSGIRSGGFQGTLRSLCALTLGGIVSAHARDIEWLRRRRSSLAARQWYAPMETRFWTENIRQGWEFNGRSEAEGSVGTRRPPALRGYNTFPMAYGEEDEEVGSEEWGRLLSPRERPKLGRTRSTEGVLSGQKRVGTAGSGVGSYRRAGSLSLPGRVRKNPSRTRREARDGRRRGGSAAGRWGDVGLEVVFEEAGSTPER